MRTSTQRLAAILFEELEKDGWGDIDPTLFGLVADGYPHGEDCDEDDRDEDLETDAQGLEVILERVVKRINPCPNCTEHAPCKEHDK